MNLVKRLTKKIRNKIHLFNRKKNWEKLKNHRNFEIRCIAKSLEFFKTDEEQWKEPERSMLEHINKIRSELAKSTKQVLGPGKEPQVQNVSHIHNVAASPPKWGELFFKIIREYKPANVLEFGASIGVSGMYQIGALKLNKKGSFISMEQAPEVAEIAENNFKKIGCPQFSLKIGRFEKILPEILNKESLIDLAFIDGNHYKIPTLQYFDTVYPFLSENSVVIFDDINWSEQMKEVWTELQNDPRIYFSFDMDKWGICVINKVQKKKDFDLYKINF